MLSESLDIDEQIGRIRRAQVESDQFIAEQRKLIADDEKLRAGRDKLFAEALKLQHDRLLSPWFATVAIVGGLVAAAAAIVNLIRASH